MAVQQEKILEMKEVYANYGPVAALIDVSLSVHKGEIVTFLGANGAGKTTTLNAIYGVMPIVRGEVILYGQRINGLTPEKLPAKGICYVPEGVKVFAPMTITDNLLLGSFSRRGKERKKEMERNFATVFALFPILKERRKRLAGTLSGGERQMLAIARGLMSSPSLLLLDEPSLGLAPALITEVMRLIAELRDKGLSVLLVEQNARASLRVADRGYVMERGKIIIEGIAGQLLDDERVRAAYLGGKTRREL
jgi:branched-chain amino acid transport system ATP-binding protein